MTAPFRVAVVGLGWAARSIWLPRLLAQPGFRVAAVVDPAPGARAEVERAGLTVPVYPDVSALTAADIDLAIVATPNHLHADIGMRLLAGGVPVFLEKPVCLTSAEADLLAAAELAGGATLIAGSAGRYRADVRALRDLLPTLGRIRHLDLAWVRARGVPAGKGWFTHRGQAGGGALIDLGWHLLDTVTGLLGATTFEQAVATFSDDFLHDPAAGAAWRQDSAGTAGTGDVEDTARGFLVTGSGVSVSMRASWASHEATDVTVIRVEGSAATATLRCTFGFSPNREGPSRLTTIRHGETTPVAVPDEPIGSEYARQVAELPALLTAPGARGRAITEARGTVAVIERLYDSAHRVPA
ncbi:Gfo/Idh/MocA family protein [Actinoplanes sp. DH11]|uniref:Gfo/Idh/MocA family protein n=1 Tax=Actinoplanes sp. DH11 TaxID=2857011 RepID=UPI001E5BEB57|nr:Gfo/Idh/MocA family oxidoreductase [Actinoplanes sp. DH11]